MNTSVSLPPPTDTPGTPTFENKLSTLLSVLSTLLLLVYYLSGAHFLPLSLLLPIAGQVLSRGILAICNLLLHLLAVLATHRPVPLDLLTSLLVEVDTRTGGRWNLYHLLLGGFVTLFLMNTPETLLGTLAAAPPDLRPLDTIHTKVQLASFGGSFNRSVYYTSGLLLLSSTDPLRGYGEVAYRTSDYVWVVPRKPTLWYAAFARSRVRCNDSEKRIRVFRNPVAVLRPVQPSNARACLPPNQKLDFGYRISMHICPNGVFGFGASGPDLPHEQGFFRLTVGYAPVQYRSLDGVRIVTAGRVEGERTVQIPRHGELWHDMVSKCFLNAVSFNRINPGMKVSERLAISSLVRVAGIEDRSGFSDPPVMAEAEVTSVRSCNLSKWVLVTMAVSVVVILLVDLYFRFQLKLVSMELAQWISMGSRLAAEKEFNCLPRYAHKSRKPFETIMVRLTSNLSNFSRHLCLVISSRLLSGVAGITGLRRSPSWDPKDLEHDGASSYSASTT